MSAKGNSNEIPDRSIAPAAKTNSEETKRIEMSASQIFASSTGLQPLSLNRISLTLGITLATLLVLKLIDAYVFCGFNAAYFVDLPIAAGLLAGCFVAPSLGLAINRKLTSKCGRRCRMLLIVLVGTWLCAVYVMSAWLLAYSAMAAFDSEMANDLLEVCIGRDIDTVKAQFSNATPTFEVFQRIDSIFRLIIAAGWFLPFAFCCAILVTLVLSFDEIMAASKNNQTNDIENQLEADRLDEAKGETIVWMSDDVCSLPATIDDESAWLGAVCKAEDERKTDSCDSAELQFHDARSEHSIDAKE